jgi:hypothetical protein
VPGSVVGLLLLFAALGPGFIWVLVSERRTPQAERTPLLETAQLIAVGGLSSLAGAAIALFVFRELDVIVPAALERDGTGYLLLHPLRAFLVLAGAATASLALAWIAARIVYRGDPPSQRPGTTWRQVLGANKDRAAVATVALRSGRLIQGVILAYELHPPTEPRDIALGQPLFVVDAATASTTRLFGDALVLSEGEIEWISVDYARPAGGS